MKSRSKKRVPVYQQITEILRAAIVSDPDPQSRPLPSEHDLVQAHGAARETIRRALAVLVREGLIRRIRGHGTVTVPEAIRARQRMRHTRRIVVHSGLLARPEHPTGYTGQIYQGVLHTAEQAGYTCVLHQTYRFPSIAQAAPDDPGQVLGVILVQIEAEPLIAMHVEAGYPVVCVDHSPAHPLADAVLTDCFTEGRQAVEFLLRHGHRELFYAGQIIRHSPLYEFQPETDALQMEAGYRYAAEVAGLAASARRSAFFHDEQVAAGALIEWMMAQRPRPTGGVLYSYTALGMLRDMLLKCGLRCPEDISLITKASTGEPVDATAVYTDGYRLGQMAAQILLARASGQQPAGMRVAITSELRRGTTVGMFSRQDDARTQHPHSRL